MLSPPERVDKKDEHGTTQPSSPPIIEVTPVQTPFASHEPREALRLQTDIPFPPHHPAPTSPQTHLRAEQWGHSPSSTSTTPTSPLKSSTDSRFRKHSNVSHSRDVVQPEPGVDLNLEASRRLYGGVRTNCEIEVIDYSSKIHNATGVMDNTAFAAWVAGEGQKSRSEGRNVRWINVAGIDFEVLFTIAKMHAMHPIAVKSLFRQHDRARSKSDYYHEHLHLRVLAHILVRSSQDSADDQGNDGDESPLSSLRDVSPIEGVSSTPIHRARTLRDHLSIDGTHPTSATTGSQSDIGMDSIRDVEAGRSNPSRVSSNPPTYPTDANAAKLWQQGDDLVDVDLKLLDVFMYQDGTIITFAPGPDLSFTTPISRRLCQAGSLLRQTADASLLLQSLLDLVADRTLEVADEYRVRIQDLKRAVLKAPEVPTVRALHVLSAEIIFRKRTMGPIKTLVSVLKDSDAKRSAVAMGRRKSGQSVSPYITPEAKVYLADVQEHMEYALANLDMYADITKNLMEYTFDMASYEMNKAMRSLNLVTVIFFPLTLLTGYFGMNFTSMWSVQEHSDLLFWKIALPVLIVCLPLFLWQDLMRGVRHLKRLWIARTLRNIAKDLKKPGARSSVRAAS
ncbi:unnamed protein product [Peniophora sp. CBMAI 1063]|nr:unnamed protein product [Peniophora sp. CBMAI 1063]